VLTFAFGILGGLGRLVVVTMGTLLTFTGFHDPYSVGLVGEELQAGPILSLVGARTFERVILFSTPTTSEQTEQTKDALTERHPDLDVKVLDARLSDPTDYSAIMRELRRHSAGILKKRPHDDYYISVASGTPQMHACWVLLTTGGEIPARILHVRPPRYVTRSSPLVSEVDLTGDDFPDVCAAIVREPAPAIGLYDHVGLDDTLAELGIVGEHPSYIKALKMAAVVAEHNTPALIQGETGTGKELIAQLIHRMSGRDRDCFVPVNCGAMPENLIESLLFGHVKGAFTGADSYQMGKFEQADGGTLFLDEIGELPVELQPRLLRVLEDGIIEPLGAKKSKKVDVRVVAATNRDLEAAIEDNAFREDLYYRISFSVIQLPALRERPSDIPLLALHILDKLNRSIKRSKRLAPDALARLQKHKWRGNVRDLENVLGRSMLMASQDLLSADDLLIDEPKRKKDPLASLPDPREGFELDTYIKSVRKQMMLRALELAHGSQSKAAKLLGLSPQAVHKFVKGQES
jgi:transcriptional regulator with AAA-type ATPase domain